MSMSIREQFEQFRNRLKDTFSLQGARESSPPSPTLPISPPTPLPHATIHSLLDDHEEPSRSRRPSWGGEPIGRDTSIASQPRSRRSSQVLAARSRRPSHASPVPGASAVSGARSRRPSYESQPRSRSGLQEGIRSPKPIITGQHDWPREYTLPPISWVPPLSEFYTTTDTDPNDMDEERGDDVLRRAVREAIGNQRESPSSMESASLPLSQPRTRPVPAPHSSPNKRQAVPFLGTPFTISLAQVIVEITPIPLVGQLVGSLKSVFAASGHTRVNTAQWGLLQHRCVMVARMAGVQVTNSGLGDGSGFKKAANMLKDAFEAITARARHYNEMEQATEFFQFEAISEEIKYLFGTLDLCLTLFSFTTEVAQSQWINEFHIVQEKELDIMRDIREKILTKNKVHVQSKVEQAEATSKRTESLRSKGMLAQEMFECLKRHGCQDLTEQVDMKAILSHAVATGAYGDIFKGTLDDSTDIAIKVWSFRRAEEAPHKCLKGAMRELYHWSKADHKNIQKLLGVVMFKGRLGMVSRWMSNGNLQDYIRQHQPEDRYQLCMQAAKAVQHLHKEQMVHGDLKACNFLVSSDGVVKLTDFDHSIISSHSIVFSQTTTMGGGTMRWMAPELVMDEGEVEMRSTQADIYALGMTMLEIITGAFPYLECQSDSQVFYKLSDKTLPKRTQHFQDVRGEQMWKLLEQCWDHVPTQRPSADQVVDSLVLLISATAPRGDDT